MLQGSALDFEDSCRYAHGAALSSQLNGGLLAGGQFNDTALAPGPAADFEDSSSGALFAAAIQAGRGLPKTPSGLGANGGASAELSRLGLGPSADFEDSVGGALFNTGGILKTPVGSTNVDIAASLKGFLSKAPACLSSGADFEDSYSFMPSSVTCTPTGSSAVARTPAGSSSVRSGLLLETRRRSGAETLAGSQREKILEETLLALQRETSPREDAEHEDGGTEDGGDSKTSSPHTLQSSGSSWRPSLRQI